MGGGWVVGCGAAWPSVEPINHVLHPVQHNLSQPTVSCRTGEGGGHTLKRLLTVPIMKLAWLKPVTHVKVLPVAPPKRCVPRNCMLAMVRSYLE